MISPSLTTSAPTGTSPASAAPSASSRNGGARTAPPAMVKAMSTVAADADPVALVEEPDKLRIWGSIPALAAETEVALDALVKAARVAGIPDDEPNQIGLALVIPDGIKRRDVWAAWEHREGRVGRWGALHTLGVTIASQSTLEAHSSYRAPMPMQVEHRRSGIGWGTYHVDPEDEFEAAPVEDEVAEPSAMIG